MNSIDLPTIASPTAESQVQPLPSPVVRTRRDHPTSHPQAPHFLRRSAAIAGNLAEVARRFTKSQLELVAQANHFCELVSTLLNAGETTANRVQSAQGLEELIENRALVKTSERHLLAEQFPEEFGLGVSCSTDLHLFIEKILSLQSCIVAVREAFAGLPDRIFSSKVENCRRVFWRAAVEQGFVRAMVLSLSNADKPRENFDVAADPILSAFPACRVIVARWAAALGPGQPEPEQPPPDKLVSKTLHQGKSKCRKKNKPYDRLGDRNRVLDQQKRIGKMLQDGDLKLARKRTETLVLGQVRRSGKEYASQTLCALARRARQNRLFELQLEWNLWAHRLQPNHSFPAIQLGLAYISNADYDLALRHLRFCVGKFFDDALARNSLAFVLTGKRRYEEALVCYRFVADHFPDNRNARTGCAEVLKTLRRYDESLAAYDASLKLQPGDALIICQRADLLRRMGRLREALDAFNSVLVRRPDFQAAMSGRETVAQRLQQEDQVHEELEFIPCSHLCFDCLSFKSQCQCD